MILFDTDTCIELLRGNREVIVRREQELDAIAVSFMTVGELFYGAEKSPRPAHNLERVERFLTTVFRVDTDLEILRRFGGEKARLQQQGVPLPDADVLIAATALCRDARLITGNLRHFQRFENLQVEDWSRDEGP